MNRNIEQHQLSYRKFLLYAACLGIFIGYLSVLYYTALQLGFQIIWQNLPNAISPGSSGQFRYYAWILTTIGGFLVGLAVQYLGAPTGINVAINEIHDEGCIDYRKNLGMIVASLLSLIFGSSAGPEAPLVDINGSLGSWLGERLNLGKDKTRILTFCGMSAALGAFFGSPMGSALLALELPHRLGLEYYEALIPVIVSAVIGFAVFRFATGLTIGGFYHFPSYGELHSTHMVYALFIGAIGAGVAVIFAVILQNTRRLTDLYSHRPIVLTTLGGLGIGLVAAVLPLTLFYGEQQIQTLIDKGAEIGVGLLLLTALGKMFTASLCLHSGFRGGLIFVLLFIGADVGMAVSLLMPQMPSTVGIICMMAAVTVAALRTPVSIVLILTVISDTDLMPLVTVAAIASFLLTNRLSIIPTQRSRRLQTKE